MLSLLVNFIVLTQDSGELGNLAVLFLLNTFLLGLIDLALWWEAVLNHPQNYFLQKKA